MATAIFTPKHSKSSPEEVPQRASSLGYILLGFVAGATLMLGFMAGYLDYIGR